MDEILLRPIGVLHTPFRQREGTPRQAAGASAYTATLEVFEAYQEGLKDLEGFSHLVVLFHLHRIDKMDLTACPPWDDKPHGVFSTCSPFRPNPIGVSVVKLEKIEGRFLTIRGVDMLDGSPVVDIKPYIPDLYPRENVRLGWMSGKVDGMTGSRSGDR
jgi:tRNA-Thr(GGU) m(6)t(6)A37 methyltransferase TsaA